MACPEHGAASRASIRPARSRHFLPRAHLGRDQDSCRRPHRRIRWERTTHAALDLKNNSSGVPAGTTAALVNLVATGTTTAIGGFMAIYRNGITFPGHPNLNWSGPNQTVAVAACDCTGRFGTRQRLRRFGHRCRVGRPRLLHLNLGGRVEHTVVLCAFVYSWRGLVHHTPTLGIQQMAPARSSDRRVRQDGRSVIRRVPSSPLGRIQRSQRIAAPRQGPVLSSCHENTTLTLSRLQPSTPSCRSSSGRALEQRQVSCHTRARCATVRAGGRDSCAAPLSFHQRLRVRIPTRSDCREYSRTSEALIPVRRPSCCFASAAIVLPIARAA